MLRLVAYYTVCIYAVLAGIAAAASAQTGPDVYLEQITVELQHNKLWFSAPGFDKLRQICVAGAEQASRVRSLAYYPLLDKCAQLAVLAPTKDDVDAGARWILLKHYLKTGSHDTVVLLNSVAQVPEDAIRFVKLMHPGRSKFSIKTAVEYRAIKQEAADLLVYFFETNPSLMYYRDSTDKQIGFDAAFDLDYSPSGHGVSTALDYYKTKRREALSNERWAQWLSAGVVAIVAAALIADLSASEGSNVDCSDERWTSGKYIFALRCPECGHVIYSLGKKYSDCSLELTCGGCRRDIAARRWILAESPERRK